MCGFCWELVIRRLVYLPYATHLAHTHDVTCLVWTHLLLLAPALPPASRPIQFSFFCSFSSFYYTWLSLLLNIYPRFSLLVFFPLFLSRFLCCYLMARSLYFIIFFFAFHRVKYHPPCLLSFSIFLHFFVSIRFASLSSLSFFTWN